AERARPRGHAPLADPRQRSPDRPGQQVVTTSIQPLAAVTDSDDRFGIGNVYPDLHWLNLARDAGVRWNRWEFRWSSIERREGISFWSGSDLIADTNQSARTKLKAILISTPRWDEGKPDHETSTPRGLYEPWDYPANTWGRFVRTIAERYRGRVQAWEIW